MKFIQNNNDYIIRLETGEELLAQLTGFCAEHDIKSGYIINGIGGVQRATVGYYNTVTLEFALQKFTRFCTVMV